MAAGWKVPNRQTDIAVAYLSALPRCGHLKKNTINNNNNSYGYTQVTVSKVFCLGRATS